MQHKSQAHIFFLFAFSIFEVLLDCSNFIIHSVAPSKTLASKVVLLSLCDSRYLQDYVIQKNTKDGSLSPLCLNCKLFVLSWKRSHSKTNYKVEEKGIQSIEQMASLEATTTISGYIHLSFFLQQCTKSFPLLVGN